MGRLGCAFYFKPLILLIWIGTIFMALGAGIAMTDRRFRVGAPVRAKRLKRRSRARLRPLRNEEVRMKRPCHCPDTRSRPRARRWGGVAPPALAAPQPHEILDDPELEQRARALSANLRCLVCQNQSIDDSDAPLARDLRVLVRERLLEGDTDDEIEAFVVARYGDFVAVPPALQRQYGAALGVARPRSGRGRAWPVLRHPQAPRRRTGGPG